MLPHLSFFLHVFFIYLLPSAVDSRGVLHNVLYKLMIIVVIIRYLSFPKKRIDLLPSRPEVVRSNQTWAF